MRHRLVLGLRVFFAALILMTATAGSPVAEVKKNNRSLGHLTSKSEVKYFAPTDTYFQLIFDLETHNQGPNWSEAVTLAARSSYKGRVGKLAIIDTPEEYSWFVKNFDLPARHYAGRHGGNTWIGMRYVCRTREMVTAAGEPYARAAYSFWDVPWYREDLPKCGESRTLKWMGIYIKGETNRWRAVGFKKRFPHYLVEYPPQ